MLKFQIILTVPGSVKYTQFQQSSQRAHPLTWDQTKQNQKFSDRRLKKCSSSINFQKLAILKTATGSLYTSPIDLSPRVESRMIFLYTMVISPDFNRIPVLLFWKQLVYIMRENMNTYGHLYYLFAVPHITPYKITRVSSEHTIPNANDAPFHQVAFVSSQNSKSRRMKTIL